MNTRALSPFISNVLYYEICHTTSQHRLEDGYFLQRYVQVAKNPYYKFCKSVGHNEEESCSFNLMMERTQDAYRVQADAQGHEGHRYHGGRYNFRGCGHGGTPGRGLGQVIFYNCNQLGQVSRDCQNLTTTCRYCKAVDHISEACLELID